MSVHSIEAGQRLQTKSGGKSGVVHILAEAVVPAGYWVCRDEASGHQTVIAQTALFPIAIDPAPIAVAVPPVPAAPV
jgi:hypothetical protein